MENTPQTPPVAPSGTDGKTVAIVSYITLIGWIVALILNSSNRTALGSFHLRQMLMLVLAGVALGIVRAGLSMIPYVGGALSFVCALAGIGLFVLWVLGLVGAANGEQKPLPLIGPLAQEWFKGL
ncbi:hypothetical protein [Compostibacter hankyongensis]|uniref:DUF4870 domain-containing protein n=1 Tax=Compostibacter hankyongensis TaxID=1007089 RepID=A0ABP8G2B1_9BACT